VERVSEFREAFVRLYPTTIKLPLWVRPFALRSALSTLRVSDITVRHISQEFSLRGLMRSPLRPDIKPALHPEEVVPEVRAIAPIDGTEVVEWMQISAAENVVMQARIAEYNALGSQQVGQSGDSYIPGVVVEDIRFVSELGATVNSRGYGVASTPRGNFNVPNLRKSTGIFRDLLSWGSISWCGSVQWIGNLLKWKSLASTPIQQVVGFYMDYRGNVAPNFFVQQPTRPALTVTVRQIFESDDSQTLTLNFRDPSDYTRVLATKQFDIASGQSQVSFTLSAFPYVPPLIAEIQPQDNKQTKLDQYVVT
jgi:hypothetical protein